MEGDFNFKHVMPAQIRFSDVDQFGHVNNSVYFSLYDLAKTTYIKEALGDIDWSEQAIVVANINANFFTPVFFSDQMEIETAVIQLGHKSFTLLQRAVQKDTREVGSRNGVYYVEEAANSTIKAYYVDNSGYYWIISGFVTGGNDYNTYKDALIDFCTSGKIN